MFITSMLVALAGQRHARFARFPHGNPLTVANHAAKSSDFLAANRPIRPSTLDHWNQILSGERANPPRPAKTLEFCPLCAMIAAGDDAVSKASLLASKPALLAGR